LNIPNIDRKRELTVKTQILKGLEEIEEKSGGKNNLRGDNDRGQRIERRIKKEDTLHQGHYPKIEEI
jgi:hypothetical protein